MPTLLSPLRYPGSKRRLAGYISEMIRLNDLEPELFVEVFAGGASLSLQLLYEGTVEKIGLIEIDPLVASFWKTVFSEKGAAWLIKQVEDIEVTVAKWKEYKGTVPDTQYERALACLYLNRTSFSGILAPSSGPLGGYDQTSAYPIDCRFPRKTLARRLEEANALRDKVAFVWQLDWQEGLARIRDKQALGELTEDVFYYLDPPFFQKADRLYNYYFTEADHETLRDTVIDMTDPWVLSYDYCDDVDRLYGEYDKTHDVEMLYSAAQNGGQRKAREVILTNLHQQPESKQMWHTSQAYGNGRSHQTSASH